MFKGFLSILSVFFFIKPASADPALRRGAVCFTFDDYGGQNWIKADSLFKKYDAHATFLVVGKITEDKAEVMKKLQAAGHSVGLHSLNHRNANPLPRGWNERQYIERQVIPQLDDCKKYGIKVRCFAYPNNRRTEKTDQALFKYFDYLRAGRGKDKQKIYTPLEKIQPQMVLGGGGIGEYYKSDPRKLKELLTEAHKRDALIVFFSHNIAPKAKHVHMPVELLETLLKHARKLDMHIVGAEELEKVRELALRRKK